MADIFSDTQDATDQAPHAFALGSDTGFFANVGAGFDSTLRTGLSVSGDRRKAIAYAPLVDALNADKPATERLTNPYTSGSWGFGGTSIRKYDSLFSGPFSGVTPDEQEASIWSAIAQRRQADPGFLPGIPATQKEFTDKIIADNKAALAADQDVTDRASFNLPLFGSAGAFAGSLAGGFRDPVNVLTLPLAGGTAKTLLGTLGREAAFNAGVTAAAQPGIAQGNRELGINYGLDDSLKSIVEAGAGGALLGAAGHGVKAGYTHLVDAAHARATLDRMSEITLASESGGHDLAPDGSVLTSSAGAEGRMQVMPTTNLDPGFGVKPAADQSLEERARVGREYLAAMMRKYDNDPAKAWAAYNWGPGHVDRAIGAYGESWLEHAPAETRAYVNGNLDKLGAHPQSTGAPGAQSDIAAAHATIQALEELHQSSPMPAGIADDARHIDILSQHVDALEHDQPPPDARVDPIELKRPTEASIDRYDPRELGVDANRFQFKSGANSEGVSDRLAGVKEWSPILSGKAVVWVDKDGKPFVADGHQRVGLARRLLEENPDADIKIDAVTLKESDGITAEMARTWAALKNIAEGSGSAVDAAKILRTAGDNVEIPLPPRSALVRDARSLAGLSNDAFGMIVNEIVPPEYGALVGRLAPDHPEMHAAYLQLLHRLAPANLTQADSIIRQAIAAGATRETQLGLFGEEVVSRSLYAERARVLDAALRRLRNDKRVFSTLTDAKDNIEAAGNVLDANANAQKVESNAQALEILTRLAHRTGPVSDALGAAAGELAAGRPVRAAVDRFVASLDGLDLSELARGVERSDGDGAMAGGRGRQDGAAQQDIGLDTEPAGGEADDRADDALGNPLLEAAASDVHEGLQLAAFSDPHDGPGVATQTEMLEHDVRRGLEAGQEGTAQRDATPAGSDVPANDRGAPRGSPAAPGTILDRETVTAAQRGQPIETLLAHAEANQAELGEAGDALASELGVDWHDPGVKSEERAREKLEHGGYADAGELLDLARGAFVVDTAEQGQALAEALLKRFALFDKGWKRLDSGYLDRKLILQFANGGTAEVQIVPRGIWDYRRAGGHKLYEEARAPGVSHDRATELNRQMAEGYDAAVAGSSFDQSAGMATLGNSLEKAATESGTPSTRILEASAGDAGRQAAPEKINADTPPLSRTSEAARPSSSNSLNSRMEQPPSGDVREDPQSVNEAVTWLDDGDPELARHNADAEQRARADADQARAELQAKSPLRGGVDQADVDGLALFDHDRSPDLFAMGLRVGEDGETVPDMRGANDVLTALDAEEAAWNKIEECMV